MKVNVKNLFRFDQWNIMTRIFVILSLIVVITVTTLTVYNYISVSSNTTKNVGEGTGLGVELGGTRAIALAACAVTVHAALGPDLLSRHLDGVVRPAATTAAGGKGQAADSQKRRGQQVGERDSGVAHSD